jgi:AraC-like DNA-binding protein
VLQVRKGTTKNTAMGSPEEIMIEDGFYILRFQNDSDETTHFERDVDTDLIQFHFGVKGRAKFIFNQGRYALDLREELSLFLYNPQKELPVHLEISPHSWVLSVLVSIKKFHGFFSEQADHIPFLSPENTDKKYYKDEKINPSMAIVLSQLFHFNLHPSIKKLYFKGKVYELLSLYFNRAEDPNAEQCPFLIDEENVIKIRKAKDFVIANMAEPPGLQELADQVGINLKKLKMGFRQIYGDSVYSFLFDYKMDYSRKLLDSGSFNVNEVGLRIGYSTSSHFIAAFKKKFGTTPKKYLMSINEKV